MNRNPRVGAPKSNHSGGPSVTVNPRMQDIGKDSPSSFTVTAKATLADGKAAFTQPAFQDEEDILAAPKSSDDEDEVATPHYRSDNEPGDDSPPRDVRPSSFNKRVMGRPFTKRKLKTLDIELSQEQNVLTTLSEAQVSSSSGKRRHRTGGRTVQKKVNTELQTSTKTDIFGMVVDPKQSRKRKPGYGAKSSQTSVPSSSFSPKPLRNLPSDVSSSPSTPHKPFKTPKWEDLGSPDDKPTFKNPRDAIGLDLTPPSVKKQFTMPKMLRSLVLGEEEPQAVFRRPAFYGSFSDDNGEDQDNDAKPTSKSNISTKLASTVEANLATHSQSGFRLPSMLGHLAKDSPAQPDERTLQEATNECDYNLQEKQRPSPDADSEPKCPMCGETVDGDFLETYHGGKMNIRMQAKFCRAHKKKSARETWTSRGYPDINWSELDRRIETHHQHLQDLLDGKSSYYREVAKELIKDGKSRTLKQAMLSSGASLTPGYYGSRGQRVMSENILKNYSPSLRRLAVKDRVISAQGVAGYVQAVLVPELAVILIMEDLDVDVEHARDIMRDSVSLGDLVNEEEPDVVEKHVGDGYLQR